MYCGQGIGKHGPAETKSWKMDVTKAKVGRCRCRIDRCNCCLPSFRLLPKELPFSPCSPASCTFGPKQNLIGFPASDRREPCAGLWKRLRPGWKRCEEDLPFASILWTGHTTRKGHSYKDSHHRYAIRSLVLRDVNDRSRPTPVS